jgi:hypothetical protein
MEKNSVVSFDGVEHFNKYCTYVHVDINTWKSRQKCRFDDGRFNVSDPDYVKNTLWLIYHNYVTDSILGISFSSLALHPLSAPHKDRLELNKQQKPRMTSRGEYTSRVPAEEAIISFLQQEKHSK